MAGIVAIPQEYFEAARIDGAGPWKTLRTITMPLSRGATATVIILSLIGGLRSFDIIWATTGGGPGFTSDVIASVIYKEYQAGFYGLSAAGNVVLFLVVTVIMVPLTYVLNRRQVGTMTRVRVRAWTVGIIAIIVSIVVFIVPFVFVVLQASKSPADASTLAFSWPKQWQFLAEPPRRARDERRTHLACLPQQRDPDRNVRRSHGHSRGHDGYVLARRKTKWNWIVNFFVLAGLIVPPAVVPTIWVLQHLHLFGTLPGMILIESTFGLSFSILLFRAFVGTIPRELDEAAVTRRRRPVHACSSGWSCHCYGPSL